MKKAFFGLMLLACTVSFANNNAKEVEKISVITEKKAESSTLAACSVTLSPGNTLTLNCGTCSGTECLSRLANILKNMKAE